MDSEQSKQKMVNVSFRLPAELLEKCGWAGEAVGLDRSAFVRNTLAHATRDAEPPKTRENLTTDPAIVGRFVAVGKATGKTVDYLLLGCLAKLEKACDKPA